MWIIRFDLEWGRDFLDLATYTGNERPFNLCRGNDLTHPWTDCRKEYATWLETMWTNAAFEAAYPDRHILFRHVPGAKILMYIPDVLHCKYLGSDQYMLASVLVFMICYMG